MTPLEAFNKIISGGCKGKYREYCEIVENALKELKEYKKCIGLKEAQFISTHNMSVVDTETFNQLVKNSQALEIIKEKEVDLFSIKYTASFEMYNYRMRKSGFAYAHRLLTQEEYDFLKEILL